jgi:hypothetical protein
LKKHLAVALIVVVFSASLLAFGYYWVNQSQKPVDDSWIANVNQFLKDAKPYPEWKQEYTLNAFTVSLFENGTSQFVEATNGNNLTNYLQGILNRANTQLNLPTDSNSIQNMLEVDTVANVNDRLGSLGVSNSSSSFVYYREAFFVLEDKLDQGLKGAILVEDLNGTNSWWAITK